MQNEALPDHPQGQAGACLSALSPVGQARALRVLFWDGERRSGIGLPGGGRAAKPFGV